MVSLPPPPRMLSLPSKPWIVWLPLLPIMKFASALPAICVTLRPVKVGTTRVSTWSASVWFTVVNTESCPPPAVSTIRAPAWFT